MTKKVKPGKIYTDNYREIKILLKEGCLLAGEIGPPEGDMGGPGRIEVMTPCGDRYVFPAKELIKFAKALVKHLG